MAPLKELDVNRANSRPSSQKKGSRKLLSKTPSMDEGPTLEEAARSMTEKLKRKRPSEEAECDDDEAVQETDLEPTQQPPQSEQPQKKNDGGVDQSELDQPQPLRYNCDQLRTKINAYIRSGEMQVKEFQEHLDVGSVAYYRFMNQKGRDKGSQSNVFGAAHNFFAVRADKGLKMPRAKKAKTSKDTTDSPSAGNKQAAKSNSSSTNKSTSQDKDLKGMDAKYDVSSVELEQETTGAVPVYDTCDDIRTKIQTHLRTTGQTQAAFGRMITHTFAVAGDDRAHKPITSAAVKSFLTKKGPTSGNTSPVFYAGYVYFEKLRIQTKKNKTKKRQEMEEAWGPDGVDVTNVLGGGQRLLLHASETAYEDKLGKLQIVPR